MSGRAAVAVMAVLITGCSVSDSIVERTVITQYGLFAMENANIQAAPETAAGKVHMVQKLPTLIATTDRVPRKKGTTFGYQFTVEGKPNKSPLDVTIVVEHPPFRKPGATETSTRDGWNQTVGVGVTSYAGWTFDEEWEMVTGTWTIRVFYGPRMLTEKAFTVE